MPWVRCKLEDENREGAITVDVLLNGQGAIVRGLPFYGYYEDHTSLKKTSSPIVLNVDDVVEFGTGISSVASLPLHGKALSLEAVFPFTFYENVEAMERGDAQWTANFVVLDHDDHADLS
jgi:hypothetical protein